MPKAFGLFKKIKIFIRQTHSNQHIFEKKFPHTLRLITAIILRCAAAVRLRTAIIRLITAVC